MRGRDGVRLRSPSGRRVELAWDGNAGVSGVGASVRYTVGGAPLGYQIGTPGYHHTASTVVAPATLRRRAVLRGREVLVSQSDDDDVTMVTRRGPHHEVMRLYLGPPPPLAKTLAELDQFRVHDDRDGCWLEPRPGTLADLVWEDLTVVVRGRGVVFVPDPRSARTVLPRGGGTRTRTGEIWRQALEDGPQARRDLRAYSYVVGSRRGAANVSVPDSVDTPDDTVLDWLDSLEVSWS
jgi:hypothetical protein